MSATFGKVAVLLGGRSREREISLLSGNAVLAALKSRGIDAVAFDPSARSVFELQALGIGRVFIALHGRFGEDGTVQGALELMGIPYTGSGVMASALALDKARTKMLWHFAGIPTAPFCRMTNADSAPQVLRELGETVFVKPIHEGSSLGVSKAAGEAQLRAAYTLACGFDSDVMVEAFIHGQELTVAILDDRALPIARIEVPQAGYDYQNKYFTDAVKYHCPAQLPAAQTEAIQRDALRAFHALGCRGWARADVMLRPDGKYFFLEMNTAPGMTGHSLVPIAARAAGLQFEDLCVEILRTAALESGGVNVE